MVAVSHGWPGLCVIRLCAALTSPAVRSSVPPTSGPVGCSTGRMGLCFQELKTQDREVEDSAPVLGFPTLDECLFPQKSVTVYPDPVKSDPWVAPAAGLLSCLRQGPREGSTQVLEPRA